MPNLKKFISVLCAASMVAASMAIPALAEDDTVLSDVEAVAKEVETLEAETAVEEAAEETAVDDTEIDLAAYKGYTFYDEDFESIPVGTLVTITSSSNTTYKNTNGITFACGSRSSDNGVYIYVKSDTTHGNYIDFEASKYNDSEARTPYFELPWMNADDATVGCELYISFDAYLANTATSLVLSDGSKTVPISTSLSDNMAVATWYHFVVVSYIDNKSYTIIISDEDGNLVDIVDGAGSLSKLTNVSALGANEISGYIDNLYIADAEVPMISMEDVIRVNIDELTTIATVTDATSISIELSDSDNFSYEYDDSTGEISITPTAKGTVDVTITAAANKELVITKTYSAGTNEDYAEESAEDIDIVEYNSATGITANSDGTYTATAGFSVPVSDRGATITWSSSDTSLIAVSPTGKATVNYPDAVTTVTLTALVNYNGSKVERDFEITLMASEEYLSSILSGLDIVNSSNDSDYAYVDSNLTKNDSTYTAVGDFTIPTTYSGATITWSSSDTDMLTVDSSGNAYVYPTKEGTVTLTATLTYGGATTTKEFTLDTTDYYTEYKTAFDQAVEESYYFFYTSDTTCSDIVTPAEDGAVIFSDLYLPTSRIVSVYDESAATSTQYTMTYEWTIEDNDYINADGTLNISDMDLHENTAAISCVVKYVKHDVAVFTSDTNTYTVSVQFNPEDITEYVTERVNEQYVIDDSTELREQTSTAARASALAAYLEAFVYDYQVKYDYAYSANFEDVPSTANSSSDDELPLEGYFGSKFTWSSSSSCLKIDSSTGEISVTTPSTTTTVTLTAVISSGTAATQSYVKKVKVTGKSSGSSGGSSGGSSSSSSSSSTKSNTTSSGTIALGDMSGSSVSKEETTTTTTINPNPSGFTDLDSVSWALTAINNLYVNGTINGKTSTLFYPNDSVTRAEFAKMLVLAFDFDIVSADTATFTDVPLSHWASEYVETAYANGIISGFDDGSFDPDAEITRQDMAVMVYRAAAAAGYSIEDKTDAVTFSDDDVIASYSKDAVSSLQKANIVSGLGDGSFGALETSTRAQACQIIYNVFNK